MLLKTLNKLIEENNIDPEEFAKDPYGVIDRLEDEDDVSEVYTSADFPED